MYDARLPRQVHALYESATGFSPIVSGGSNLWARNSCFAALYSGVAEQRTQLAKADKRCRGSGSETIIGKSVYAQFLLSEA
jgi:hypothetical protein